ncbi:Trinucleotide repeat-containing gene 6C protein [Collichthys lucidus]|uniref:Trinucleotide repeat-containing gene 6C protein n=1 Tax=Collichthys lucidus TaxID=240159 RepID=A0A4U5VT54_COLLU|nr:Trinucleotide repeat-containing gene 6C protein [Collichthys lucidus]
MWRDGSSLSNTSEIFLFVKFERNERNAVPDSAKLDPTPPLPPVNPSAVPSVPPSSGNGKRAPSGGQPQTAQQPQTLLQQRYPPREVPPRFRQQEHKQLLKRGQPLPSGTLPLTTGRPATTEPAVAIHSSPSCSSSSTASLPTDTLQHLHVVHTRPLGMKEVCLADLSIKEVSALKYACDSQQQRREIQTVAQSLFGFSSGLRKWRSCTSQWSDATERQHFAGIEVSLQTAGGTQMLSLLSHSCDTVALCIQTKHVRAHVNNKLLQYEGQQAMRWQPDGHFPANHLSSKANSGPSPANHTGTSMLSSQVAANRSWGSGPGPSHCPPQSSVGSEGKSDGPVGGGGSRGWGSTSSSSTNNFNLNLNPNANPSAWPMLGHDGGGTGAGSSGGANTISPPQPTPNLCNPPAPPPAQTSTCTGANTNSNSSGIGSAWGSIMASDISEPHPSPSTNVSFSSEPQNLKTDGPNHTNKQEPPSPIRNLPGWGSAPVGLGSMAQPPPGGPQVNGEDGSSVWGNKGDSKTSSSKEAPGWDSGWGHGGSGAGNSGGWGDQSAGGWGKQHTEETQGGWDAPSSPPQDPQASPWSRAVSTAAASEGSSDSMEGHPRHRDHSSRDNPAPLLPAQDLDPRVLCNTGWGQTPVRQHTSWDMNDTKRKNEGGTESWGSGPTTPSDAQGPSNTNMGPSQRTDPGGKNDVPGSQGPSGWGGSIAATNQPSPGWGEPPSNSKPTGGSGGWGNTSTGGPTTNIPKNGSQSWGEEKPSGWDDSHVKSTSQGWGEQPKASHNWGNSGGSNNAGDWREPEENKKSPTNPGWEGESGGWKEKPRGWGMPSSGPGISGAGGNGGWGEPVCQRPSGPPQEPHPKHPKPRAHQWAHGSCCCPTPVRAISQQGPPLIAQGWGEIPSSHTKSESSWGEPAPAPVSVDNGTSAWGKPTGSCGGWGDGNPDGYGRGNPAMTPASCKPAPKPMQDGWGGGGEELNLSGGQWDAEEGDMWNSTASQESNSSCNSWGNASKKVPQKGKVPGKQEDAWIMNRLIKQLTDMGFPRDPAEEALKSNNMNLDQAMSALLEKKTELDKRGMGITGHDYNNGLINKPMSCPRPPLLSKDPSADPRLPFMDKMQSGMFGGGGAAQARAMQQPQPPPQPPVPPLSSSQPSLRAQVPQFLSPQVQAQLLQFAAKNIGLNPALLTSPINPQHMTLLNQLYQLQLAYQRLQIQQQMLQAQRASGPIRQQEQQTKEPQSSPNNYSPYSLSGLNPNMNVNCMEVGSLSMKEPPQPQSRLSQWTHPHSIESLSGNSSPLEPNLGKHGANLGPPGKPHQLEDSYSPYNLMSSSESPTSPLVPPDSWGQGKSSSDKMANGTNINWPPEFCPGVPWKGLQNIDPETDPNVTPGSVPSGPTINTNIQDVNRYLLRDRSGGESSVTEFQRQNEALPPSTDWPVSGYTSSFSLSSPETDDAGKLSEMKSTWSPGPISHSQASLSHELWKVPQGPRSSNTAPSRPPPGLTNTKPSSTWGGNSLGLAQGWSSSYTTAGTTWSTDSSTRTSQWLVLRNLTPQIDGSTLRTLCMQHGPLITFHLNLTQGNAVVRYSSKDEAAKAQKSLHMCVLGNTTILAEFAGEEEVNRFFAQGQLLGGTTSWQATPATNQTRMDSTVQAPYRDLSQKERRL